MKVRPSIYLFILWISIFLHSAALSQTNPTVIDFVSDTQSPLFAERIIHKLNRNETATSLIFKDITARHPSGLFILGDVVSLGFENQKWKQVDGYLNQLKKDGVPVYATLGNHELMINAAEGEKKIPGAISYVRSVGLC